MGDSDSEHEVCHVSACASENIRYFEQGVCLYFDGVWKGGLEESFCISRSSVLMHYHYASYCQFSDCIIDEKE